MKQCHAWEDKFWLTCLSLFLSFGKVGFKFPTRGLFLSFLFFLFLFKRLESVSFASFRTDAYFSDCQFLLINALHPSPWTAENRLSVQSSLQKLAVWAVPCTVGLKCRRLQTCSEPPPNLAGDFLPTKLWEYQQLKNIFFAFMCHVCRWLFFFKLLNSNQHHQFDQAWFD